MNLYQPPKSLLIFFLHRTPYQVLYILLHILTSIVFSLFTMYNTCRMRKGTVEHAIKKKKPPIWHKTIKKAAIGGFVILSEVT
ncbi:Uncharacterised protein [Mycobacterium tuberculosis]|nr:Uncharacterised protein [Mycobacterium tuberculosis]